ncbi:helix-turn-helix domain-containing protein [Sphingopyxis granuli]|uniref:helix-turn-helix domain-containing protein n=1 Tax=Sphingopyxis granuli TaxID=267128 RepID=UPI001BAE9816|nr:helix-turn-helix transcriptional regulator [Sphingopyxis granuli]QUM73041.1 helix-turn-helix transcriptional regulator [Sphingopyxis granuli]
MGHEQSLEQKTIFAEEAAVVEVQSLLHKIMEDKGWSRSDLARAMNVTRARVTQIFSDECKNLTVRLLARAMTALGEELVISARSEKPNWISMVLEAGRASDRCSNAHKTWLEIADPELEHSRSIANDNFFKNLPNLRRIREETYELVA